MEDWMKIAIGGASLGGMVLFLARVVHQHVTNRSLHNGGVAEGMVDAKLESVRTRVRAVDEKVEATRADLREIRTELHDSTVKVTAGLARVEAKIDAQAGGD